VSKPQSPAVADSGDATTVEGVLEIVRKQGGRITSSRRLLLRALFDSKGHHTAEDLAAEVQKQAPDIHLSTIYRNLDELERLGIIVHAGR
jgi:Fur family ferric uptake transcriptional regulator